MRDGRQLGPDLKPATEAITYLDKFGINIANSSHLTGGQLDMSEQ